MALPHPESGKDKYGKEDIANKGGVIGNLFKRAVHVSQNRNAADDVDPAKDRPLDALVHEVLLYDSVKMNDDIVGARCVPSTMT
jgi:hypothetical protein